MKNKKSLFCWLLLLFNFVVFLLSVPSIVGTTRAVMIVIALLLFEGLTADSVSIMLGRIKKK